MKLKIKNSATAALLIFFLAASSAWARPVTLDTARRVAVNWLIEKRGLMAMPKSLAPAHTETVQGRNIYYVINFPSGGWLILSADDVAYPVIAYSRKGSYLPTNHPVQFDGWMNAVKNEIRGAIAKSLQALPKAKTAWTRLDTEPAEFLPRVESAGTPPLIRTTWNQGKYYNHQCPADAAGQDGHVYTGCVATAMAQVVKYYNYPARGNGSHSYVHSTYGTQFADFGNTAYHWAAMPDKLTAYNSAVATLMYHCGVSVDMDYGPSGSGANVSYYATNALKQYFRYKASLHFAWRSSYTDAQWRSLLRSEIDAGHPVLYRGSGTGGHAFVCDGYEATDSDHFHFNWGWGGYLDGYFYIDNLAPGSYDFTNSQGGILGIERAIIKGDINASGQVDLADAVTALQIVSKITPADPVEINADVNGDGAIGLAEAVFCLQKIAGLR